MFTLVLDRELCFENLLFMTDQIGHDLTVQSIHDPNHVVFASCHQHWSLVMPFYKVEVFLWDVVESPLQGKAILDIPDAQEVVHASSYEPLST